MQNLEFKTKNVRPSRPAKATQYPLPSMDDEAENTLSSGYRSLKNSHSQWSYQKPRLALRDRPVDHRVHGDEGDQRLTDLHSISLER